MFNFVKNQLKKIYTQVTSQMHTLFSRTKIDEQSLKELEVILIEADTGIKTTRTIIDSLREQFKKGHISEGDDLKYALEKQLNDILSINNKPIVSSVYLLVGVNGSGKTTFVAKLANKLKNDGKKVLLVAADTFRAAAKEQLEKWAESINVAIETGTHGQDPASVVFKSCIRYKNENFDAIIIDTAGRLQTKINLMKELEKIKKIIQRHLPDQPINTLLTIDAMLGQNSLEQARIFKESTDVNGIVLTKIDGTGKGGIIFSIIQELGIPINYVSYGEKLEQYKNFDAKKYVQNILGI